MIVARANTDLRVVTQPDHARLAAEILSLWHADGLPEHPRRKDLLFAAREHDNGWRETDAAPHADPATGRPYTFLDLPDRYRREVWERGVARFASSHPYPTLLILEHARRLHRDRAADTAWSELFERLAELGAELLERTNATPESLAEDYRWLALSDELSLLACAGWREPLERHGVRARLAGKGLEIDPFPLVGATTFRAACRYIPDRRYVSDTDLAVELASARWRHLEVRLVPAQSG